MPLNIKKLIKSFSYAFNGVRILITTQQNAWIHSVATCCAVAAGLFFEISCNDWIHIILAIVSVWVAEAFNTAIELLGDNASSEPNELIGKAKDVAAGAVLIASVGAVITGVMVYPKYLL